MKAPNAAARAHAVGKALQHLQDTCPTPDDVARVMAAVRCFGDRVTLTSNPVANYLRRFDQDAVVEVGGFHVRVMHDGETTAMFGTPNNVLGFLRDFNAGRHPRLENPY